MRLFRFNMFFSGPFSLDYFVLVLFAFVVLDFVFSSLLGQEIVWEERLRK